MAQINRIIHQILPENSVFLNENNIFIISIGIYWNTF